MLQTLLYKHFFLFLYFILLFEGLPKYSCKLGIGLAAALRDVPSIPSAFYGYGSKENVLEVIKGAFVSVCFAVWMYYSWLEGSRCGLLYKRGTKVLLVVLKLPIHCL